MKASILTTNKPLTQGPEGPSFVRNYLQRYKQK